MNKSHSGGLFCAMGAKAIDLYSVKILEISLYLRTASHTLPHNMHHCLTFNLLRVFAMSLIRLHN